MSKLSLELLIELIFKLLNLIYLVIIIILDPSSLTREHADDVCAIASGGAEPLDLGCRLLTPETLLGDHRHVELILKEAAQEVRAYLLLLAVLVRVLDLDIGYRLLDSGERCGRPIHHPDLLPLRELL